MTIKQRNVSSIDNLATFFFKGLVVGMKIIRVRTTSLMTVFIRMGMEFINLVMIIVIAIILLNYDTLIFIALILADINDDNDDFTTSTISISQKTE